MILDFVFFTIIDNNNYTVTNPIVYCFDFSFFKLRLIKSLQFTRVRILRTFEISQSFLVHNNNFPELSLFYTLNTYI